MTPGQGMKVVGTGKNHTGVERFARLQAMAGKVASRPLMRRGTVLKFRTWEEFDEWKRQATREYRAARSSPIS